MKGLLCLSLVLLLIDKGSGDCGYSSCPAPEPGYLNVHIVPHTHDDVGWLKTVDQYYYGYRNNIQRAGVQYIIDSVIQELIKDESRRFIYVESAFFWRWWGEQDLTMKETVRELVNQGRLEFISGGWSMNDEAAAHYSAIIDNMAVGIKFLQEEFGQCGRPRVGWQIDPFGHSREYANILAKFGFDGLFLGRIDYADKDKRKSTKTMEMIWKAGEGGADGEIFTGINFNTYSPPPGFCFDTLCTDVIMDNKLLEDYNLDEKLEAFISYARKQSEAYASNNIMMTMGEDFNYQDANMWYKNLDKLIKYMAQGKEEHKINLFYSTPSCYLKAVRDANIELPTKSDDFFPYASDPHAYWTGYFTSRPALKGMIRKANSLLQACKQVESRRVTQEEDPRLMVAKRSVAVNQHHDAVTGTAKQHVTDDYYLGLHRGMEACHQLISDSFKEGSSACVVNDWCPLLNISQCAFTESRDSFTTVVYNPTPRLETFYIRLPVVDSVQYQVKDGDVDVPFQINPVPATVEVVPGRDSQARFELVFQAEVGGLESKSYLITKGTEKYTATKKISINKSGKFRRFSIGGNKVGGDIFGNGDTYKLQIRSGDVKVGLGFYWYTPAVGDNTAWEKRASGAYIFRPNGTNSVPIGDPVNVEVYKGPLYDEMHAFYNEWISQVIRTYHNNDEGLVELEWMVGPIPTSDGGKEIVMRYSAQEIESGDKFLTDTNGRGLLERTRDHRDTWELDITEPISANYYPLNSRIGIRDSSHDLWVLTDRSEGGTSMQSGEMEVMVHRRLLHDDAFGVGEPLDEEAFGKGLVVRGKHRVMLCEGNCQDASAVAAERMFAEPVVQFGEPCVHKKNVRSSSEIQLPAQIKLLTMEKFAPSQILVRIENLASSGGAVSVNIQDLFPNHTIQTIQARTLDGNVAKSEVKRQNWTEDRNQDVRVPRYDVYERLEELDLLIQIRNKDGDIIISSGQEYTIAVEPGFIETYLVTLA